MRHVLLYARVYCEQFMSVFVFVWGELVFIYVVCACIFMGIVRILCVTLHRILGSAEFCLAEPAAKRLVYVII